LTDVSQHAKTGRIGVFRQAQTYQGVPRQGEAGADQLFQMDGGNTCIGVGGQLRGKAGGKAHGLGGQPGGGGSVEDVLQQARQHGVAASHADFVIQGVGHDEVGLCRLPRLQERRGHGAQITSSF